MMMVPLVVVALLLISPFCDAAALQWRSKFARIVVFSGLSFASVQSAVAVDPSSLTLMKVSKSDFLNAAKKGDALDIRNKNEMEAEVKSLEKKLVSKTESGVRVVDLGGNRGARGLASDGSEVGKGSLVNQLKAYGGIGEPEERVDNSLKNPFVYKSGIADQLNVYKNIGGGK